MRFLFSILLSILPCMASADASPLIGESGLAGAAADLDAIADPSADDRMALGGILFLRAVERAYQIRWRYGLTENLDLPLLAGELAPNPTPEPISPTMIADLFGAVIDDMAAAEDVLATIPPDADPSFELALPDLWFDVNMNGTRDADESFVDTALPALIGRWRLQVLETRAQQNPDAPSPLRATVRFDRADVYWLRAYVQAVSGISETILAFDPTDELARVIALRQSIAEQVQRSGEKRGHGLVFGGAEDAFYIDAIAVLTETMRHRPDASRLGRARDHFLAMITHNRIFWRELAKETDNDREWIPRPTQTSALGIVVPENVDIAWLAVLSDGEKLLKGELLIPHWRFAKGHGINLADFLDDPGPLPLVQAIQGEAFNSYAAQGELISSANWRSFARLVQGQAGLYALMLN
ncbi:hypothetical protein QKW60_09655 [Defluviimonas aestuarii]|uniref:hypothetical protein n=1 Tax=Albidovulum aestuarii TaxID=1130726 RepID=UPI002499BE0A|nr:hypothetical protein [Defluviimonas aestuarii]MDI3336671.1 hypothetical protein [Defluviimonas aestuarii]